MTEPISANEPRTAERIREHYRIERELADRLRNASRQERLQLYGAVYDELFRRLPDHPQLALKTERNAHAIENAWRLALLRRFLRPNSTFLEIGPGDCSLAIEVAHQVQRVYAVEASEEIISAVPLPPNMKLIISGACSVPVDDCAADIVYSDQVMEHLHPEDAVEQLRDIHRALAPSGVFVCLTPNRLSGPHDVSRDFDDDATGLHLKEYTVTELASLFRETGFARVRVLAGARGKYVTLPVAVVIALEKILLRLPRQLAKKIARTLPFRAILGIYLVGRKASLPST